MTLDLTTELEPVKGKLAEVVSELEYLDGRRSELENDRRRLVKILTLAGVIEEPARKNGKKVVRKRNVSQERLALVIEVLRGQAPMTAKAIANRSGISKGSLEYALRYLREEGVVRIVGRQRHPTGRGVAAALYSLYEE